MRVFDADSIDWDKCPYYKRDIKDWVLEQTPFVQADEDDDLTIIYKVHNSFVVSICRYLDHIEDAMKSARRMLITSIIFASSSAIAGLIQSLLLLLK